MSSSSIRLVHFPHVLEDEASYESIVLLSFFLFPCTRCAYMWFSVYSAFVFRLDLLKRPVCKLLKGACFVTMFFSASTGEAPIELRESGGSGSCKSDSGSEMSGFDGYYDVEKLHAH